MRMNVLRTTTFALSLGCIAGFARAGGVSAKFDFSNLKAGAQTGSVSQTIDGVTVTAQSYFTKGGTEQLYYKTSGGDETGLGVNNSNTSYELSLTKTGRGEHKTTSPKDFIQFDVSRLIGKAKGLSIAMGSVTGGEQWDVYEGNTSGKLGTEISPPSPSNSNGTLVNINWDGTSKYIDVSVNKNDGDPAANLLFNSINASLTPEPGTLAMLGSAAVLGVGYVLRRAKARLQN